MRPKSHDPAKTDAKDTHTNTDELADSNDRRPQNRLLIEKTSLSPLVMCLFF